MSPIPRVALLLPSRPFLSLPTYLPYPPACLPACPLLLLLLPSLSLSLRPKLSLEAQLPGTDERPFGRKAPGRRREAEIERGEEGGARETGENQEKGSKEQGRERERDRETGAGEGGSRQGLRSMGRGACVCAERILVRTHPTLPTHPQVTPSVSSPRSRRLRSPASRRSLSFARCHPLGSDFFSHFVSFGVPLSPWLTLSGSISVWRASPSRIVFSKIPRKACPPSPGGYFSFRVDRAPCEALCRGGGVGSGAGREAAGGEARPPHARGATGGAWRSKQGSLGKPTIDLEATSFPACRGSVAWALAHPRASLARGFSPPSPGTEKWGGEGRTRFGVSGCVCVCFSPICNRRKKKGGGDRGKKQEEEGKRRGEGGRQGRREGCKDCKEPSTRTPRFPCGPHRHTDLHTFLSLCMPPPLSFVFPDPLFLPFSRSSPHSVS